MLANVDVGWRLIHSFAICVLLVITTDEVEENKVYKRISVAKTVSGDDKQ